MFSCCSTTCVLVTTAIVDITVKSSGVGSIYYIDTGLYADNDNLYQLTLPRAYILPHPP